MCVAVGEFDLKHALLHPENGNIECASSEMVNSNNRGIFTIKAIFQHSVCRLVDRTKYVTTSNLTSVFQDGDDSMTDNDTLFKAVRDAENV